MTSIEHIEGQLEEQSKYVSYNVEPGARHRLRTPVCLSIPKLTAGHFTADQRAHVENCGYCSKVLRMSKRSWFSEVRTWVRVYSDSHRAMLAMRFALVAALVAVIGLSIVSQRQIGRLDKSVRVMGAQQAGIGLGLQELTASLDQPALYPRKLTPSDEGIKAIALQQRELANENRRLHQDLLVEQHQVEALLESNNELRSELSNVALTLSSQPPTIKNVDPSVTVSGVPFVEFSLGPRTLAATATDAALVRWTMFELAKRSKGTNELSWIAIPAGKEDSVPLGELANDAPVSAIVPSAAVFTRVLTSTPVEITGEPEGDDVKVHSISFLSEPKATSRPTVDPSIIIHISR